jgi:formylmethanofuran dehydrogenase subunit E
MYDQPDIFDRCIEDAVKFHGHLCGGQIIGVRMALAGLRELGMRDPRGKDRKNLVVVVEIDRCATDAIGAVTGLTPGRRSLKIKDLGKMAATFVDLSTGRAVRVCVRESSRRKGDELAAALVADLGDEREAGFKALEVMKERDLLDIREVAVDFHPSDLPGPPTHTTVCELCGESILDQRETIMKGKTCCKPCASGDTYYRFLPEEKDVTNMAANG